MYFRNCSIRDIKIFFDGLDHPRLNLLKAGEAAHYEGFKSWSEVMKTAYEHWTLPGTRTLDIERMEINIMKPSEARNIFNDEQLLRQLEVSFATYLSWRTQ